jgi:16S rRNA (cytosine1402-N4)-methyltransferase
MLSLHLLKRLWVAKSKGGSKVSYHDPVMLSECMEGMAIREDGTYVDVTYGGGGHSKALLARLGSQGKLISFDRDPDAAANAVSDSRFTLVKDNFRNMREHLRELKAMPVDGILADLGVSSHQFDEAERGFAFRFEHDLDMRMDRMQDLTAQKLLQTYPEKELFRIFSQYGELPGAGRFAAAIVHSRQTTPILSSSALLKVISPLVPKENENQVLARIYQALRIEVNDEMGALRDLLDQSADVLRSGGRLVVLSYHSLEDRLVKNYIRHGNMEGESVKDLYGNPVGVQFVAVNKKPEVPSEKEQRENPRSRSAKMRVAEKI